MSIIIKDMEMPKSCAECDAEGHYENSYGDEYGFFCPFGYKAYTEKTRDVKRLDDCPLVPVQPHGRLIDADAVFKRLQKQAMSVWGNSNPRYQIILEVMDAIRFAPTIIPKEET